MASQSLATTLRLALGRVARRLRQLYVEADEGSSFLELAVLQRLERDGSAFPGALAQGEGVTSAAVAASLGGLEGRGLVERVRDVADGRRVVVTITSAGVQTLRRRDHSSIERIDQVLRGFSRAEREQLAAAIPLLERIAREL